MTNRDIDVLIAEKIFNVKVKFINEKYGWRVDYLAEDDKCNDPIVTDMGNDGYKLKRYSTDITAAWTIVEELKNFKVSNYDGQWLASVETWNEQGGKLGLGRRVPHLALGGTAPFAICKAALKSIGIEL
jgi:hypothetical protein